MSDAVIQEFKFVTSGLNELNQNLNRLTTQLESANKSAGSMRGFDQMLTKLDSIDSKMGKMVSTMSSQLGAVSKVGQQATAQLSSVEKAATRTGATLDRELAAKLRNIQKNVNFQTYEKGIAKLAQGAKLTEAELRKLLKTTQTLQQMQFHKFDDSFKSVAGKMLGSNATALMGRSELESRVRLLQSELANTIKEKNAQSNAKAALAQQKVLLNEIKATNVARELNRTYQERLHLISNMGNRNLVTLGQLKSQLDYLKKMQTQYQYISTLQDKDKRASAHMAFNKSYGNAARKDMENVPARIASLQAEINRRTATGKRNISDILTSSQNLHGVWRGLAAASGNIWLSWGNFVPMMAGLAPMMATLKSVSAERDFGWQMAQVGAAAEVGDKAVKELGESILAMGGGLYTQSPLKMAESFRVLAQAGLSTQDAFKAIPSVLNLAMVAGTSDEDAALFAAGLRHPFGLFDQASLQAGIDQTAKAAAVSQTSIEQMMESMKQAAPAASKFGMSVSDVSTVLAALARVNITGSAAGTAFKNLLTDLGGRTPKGRKALEQLGLSAYNAAGMVKPLTQIIAELQERFQGMNDQDKQRWMKSFLDERGMRAADVLLNMTTQDFRKLHEEISRGSENMGYVSVQAERLGNTSEGAFRKMKAAWDTTFVRVGQGSSNEFQGLMNTLTNIANDPNVISGISTIANGFMMAASAGALTVKVIAPLAPLLNGIAAGGTVLAAVKFTSWVSGAMTAAVAARGAAAGVTGLTAALHLAKGALLTNPLGWLAIGVGAAVTYISAARKETELFSHELQRLPQDLGAVKTEIYTAFNTFEGGSSSSTGAGGRMDWLLGLQGNVLQDLKLKNKDASDQFVLDWTNSSEAFAGNLRKISAVTATEMGKLSGNLKTSHAQTLEEMNFNAQRASTSELELATMLTERKKTLLETQLTNLDKHLAGAQELSRQDMELRQSYEQAVYDTATRLMTLRTQLAAQQLEDLRVKAIEEMGILESTFDTISGMFSGRYSEHFRQMNTQVQMLQNGLSVEQVAKATGTSVTSVEQALAALNKMNVSGESFKGAYIREYGSLALDTVKGWNQASELKGSAEENNRAITANPTKAASLARDKLNQLEGLTKRLKADGEFTKEAQEIIETAIRWETARLTHANGLLSAQEYQKAKSSKDTLNRLNQTLSSGVERDTPASSARSAGSTNGAYPSRSRISSYSAYEPLGNKYELEAQKAAQERAKDVLDRQVKLMGFATKEVSDAYIATLDGTYKFEAQQKADEARKKANEIRKNLVEGKYSPADVVKAQADLAKLIQVVKDYSPKGSVDLGSEYHKITTTTKVTGGASQSAPLTSGVRHIGRVAGLQGNYRISSPFGWRGDIGIKGASKDHKGTDYATPIGTPLYAPESGTIMRAGKAKGYGLATYLRGDSGRIWEFGHLSKFEALAGQVVQAGQLIAKTGDTGLGGAHLHVTIRRNGKAVNPERDAIWTKRNTGLLTSVATNKKGETTETYESSSFQGQQIVGTNAEDGAELVRLQEKVALNQKDLQSHYEAERLLKTRIVDAQRELELQKVKLDGQQSLGILTSEEYLSQQQALQTAELKLQHETELLQKKSEQALTEEQIAEFLKLQSAELDHQKAVQNQKAKTEAAKQDWRTGRDRALASISDEAVNYAEFAKKQVDVLTGGLTNAFEQVALTGKVNFRELTVSILQDLAKIYARMAAMQLIKTVFSSFSGGAGAGAGGTDYIGYLFARGGAFHNGNLTAYANGGLINSPTYFGFNGGRGLMGEAGSEAIMPLQRMANGDLGVSVAGSMGGGAVVNAPVTVSVVVNSDGSSNSKVEAQQAKELGEAIRTTVINEVGKMLRPNGMINQSIRSGGAA